MIEKKYPFFSTFFSQSFTYFLGKAMDIER